MPCRLAVPLALSLFALSGCDSGAPVPTRSELLPADARYAWSFEHRHAGTDSVEWRAEEAVRVRTVGRGAEVGGYEDLFVVETTTERGDRSRAWYRETDARLLDVAYTYLAATPMAQPRGSVAAADVFAQPFAVAELLRSRGVGRRGAGDEDSVIVRDDLRVVYALPLEAGREWVSFTDPFHSTRKVVGRDTVTVAAGTFAAFVVETEIDVVGPEDEFVWRDYVVPGQGLVLRTLEGVQDLRDENNNPVGSFRWAERLELVAGR